MSVWSLIIGYTAGLLTALLLLCWNYSRPWPKLDKDGSVVE